MRVRLLPFMFVLAVFALPLPASAAPEKLLLELPGGKVVIRLMPDIAPKHVEQVKTLTQQGFYDGLAWFRVIDGFIAQTGYPKGSRGKSSLPDLPAEFSRYTFRRGTVGMGHGEDLNSANSQFFICLTDAGCKDLTGQYTAWGHVESGMDAVDALKRGEPPSSPDETVSLTVEGDTAPKQQKSGERQKEHMWRD